MDKGEKNRYSWSVKILKLAATLSCLAAPVDSWGATYRVSAWTFGDEPSLQVSTDRSAIDEVNVDWYLSRADGSLDSDSSESAAFIAGAHSRGLDVLATVTNLSTVTWDFDPALAHKILASPSLRIRHVSVITRLCVSKGYDGIDLDWESLYANDRGRFTQFVRRLATRLHRSGKTLTIAVHAKTSEPGCWSGARAEDYAALGAAVDESKIMTYDYSGSWSDPGPVAPPEWSDAVLSFAESAVPASKIMMGVPFYGYDWSGSTAVGLTWSDAQELLSTYHPTVTRDASGEATFEYADSDGRAHTVYFQDRTALRTKFRMLLDKHPAILGIAIWRMEDEAAGFWDEIAADLR